METIGDNFNSFVFTPKLWNRYGDYKFRHVDILFTYDMEYAIIHLAWFDNNNEFKVYTNDTSVVLPKFYLDEMWILSEDLKLYNNINTEDFAF